MMGEIHRIMLGDVCGLHALGMFVADLFKSRWQLEAENLFLRHQDRDWFDWTACLACSLSPLVSAETCRIGPLLAGFVVFAFGFLCSCGRTRPF
jgi:hypothetical protein